MLEQLLMVEQSHKQALYKLEDEKRNHGEFMKKSDEFTNLLEQERERSVHESKRELANTRRCSFNCYDVALTLRCLNAFMLASL